MLHGSCTGAVADFAVKRNTGNRTTDIGNNTFGVADFNLAVFDRCRKTADYGIFGILNTVRAVIQRRSNFGCSLFQAISILQSYLNILISNALNFDSNVFCIVSRRICTAGGGTFDGSVVTGGIGQCLRLLNEVGNRLNTFVGRLNGLNTLSHAVKQGVQVAGAVSQRLRSIVRRRVVDRRIDFFTCG